MIDADLKLRAAILVLTGISSQWDSIKGLAPVRSAERSVHDEYGDGRIPMWIEGRSLCYDPNALDCLDIENTARLLAGVVVTYWKDALDAQYGALSALHEDTLETMNSR